MVVRKTEEEVERERGGAVSVCVCMRTRVCMGGERVCVCVRSCVRSVVERDREREIIFRQLWININHYSWPSEAVVEKIV